MAGKQQSTKRRVAVARREETRRTAAAKRDRRRRLLVGGVTAFLALALIAPLTAGLILNQTGDDDSDEAAPTTTFPDLPWVPAERGGATLTGATPCPPTDGSAERTTGFASPPPQCIGDDSTHELTFTTDQGSFVLPVDAALDGEAANLAVTFAHYRTYEQVPVTLFVDGGLLWIGGDGDTGFTLPGRFRPEADPYPVGSVVLTTGFDAARLDGTIAVVLSELAGTALAADPRHAVIGRLEDPTALAGIGDTVVTGVTATETS